jgi:outer membrane protein assembly factor BamB
MITRIGGAVLLAVSLCACPLAFAADSATGPGISGYFGDRTGVYPGAKPPVRWGEGTNVLWNVMLPNLGNGAPVVAGDRVIVLSEPGWKHDLPVISCYAAADGKLLWEKEIDHLRLTVPDEAARKTIRDHWHKHLAWIRDYYLLFHDYSANKESADVKRRMDEMGVVSWGANYLYGKFDDAKVSDYAMPRFARKFPEVGKALIGLDTWRCMGSHDMMWIGEVFGTPVTDGKAVYLATAWGVYASYDLDGRELWMRAMSPERPHDYCAVARSPLLWRDLFISDLGRMVRAFDRATGELKWEQRRAGGVHEFVSPVILRVGGQEVLWTAGPAAFALPDGKPLKIEGWPNNGMMVAVNTDRPDTLLMVGGGEHGGWEDKGGRSNPPPAAVRFTMEGDALKARVLWNTVNGNPAVGAVGLLYNGGRLYFSGAGGVILDAETGLVIKGLFGGAVPDGNHHMAIAGGHVYGLSTDGTMGVHALDGRPVARNALRVTPFDQLDKDNQTKRLSQWFAWPKAENRNWCFSYASPFAVAGDRIYIRSLDHLYCIADKGEAKPAEQAPAASAAPLDPAAAQQKREALVNEMVASNLHDARVPPLAEQLYELGPVPRELLKRIEEKIDARMYPINGPKFAQDFVSAVFRRSGEVGFARVWLHPMPWHGGPKRGAEIRLEWQALNATKVTIEPGIGEVPVTGEHKLTLNEPAVFTLTAEGPGGPSVRTVKVSFPEGK